MDYLNRIRGIKPLVHCITNTVTVNDCANALLAIGARAMMAEHPLETAGITASAGALLINTGSITDVKIRAMKNSVLSARENDIPFVLDCVGVSSSEVRRLAAEELISIHTPHIIKGNASEISALCTKTLCGGGVDSACSADEAAITQLAKKLNTVIAVTGETDVISDGNSTAYVENGVIQLSSLTGTGCMTGCIMAALLTVTDAYTAAISGAAIMGICGEAASEAYCGMGTFHMRLMDALSVITDETLHAKMILR